jgi:hypothetical protein
MSIPIKSDTIIVQNLSGTNIFADYVDVVHTPGSPGVDFQITPTNFRVTDDTISYGITLTNLSPSPGTLVFNIAGPFASINLANGQISGQNIYQSGSRVIDESQTGLFYPASNPSGFTTGGGGAGIANIYEIRFFT